MIATDPLQELQEHRWHAGAILRARAMAQGLLALVGFVLLAAAAHPTSRAALVSVSNEVLLSQAAVALRATVPPGVNFSAGPIQPPVLSAKEREQKAVTEMLSKRYRVAQEA